MSSKPSYVPQSESLPAGVAGWPFMDVSRFTDIYSTPGFQVYSNILKSVQPPAISGSDLLESWTDMSVRSSIFQNIYSRLGIHERSVLDTHLSKFSAIEESTSDISGAIAILENQTTYPTSASRVQAIKANLKLNGRMVKSVYYAILRNLKRVLSTEDFNNLRRELAGQIESMQSIISRMTKKMKSVARLVSCAGFTIDRRQEHRKKLKVILRQSDEEDSI